MKKNITLLLTIILTSCYPSKQVISENYQINSELNFKVLKYSEPTVKPNYIRSEKNKYVDITITMTNKSSKSKDVDFTEFYISSELNKPKSRLWRVSQNFERIGIENTSVKFNAFESKKLWLTFLTPKNEQIKFLFFNGKKIELNFGKTKQNIF